MKKLLSIFVFTLLICISATGLSHAQDKDKDFGLGFILGEPTGISLKSWTGGNNAIDAGLAWSLGQYDAINVHADYLWHNYSVFEDVDKGTLPLYYGIGGRVVFVNDYPNPGDDDALIGARIPVGINYLFEDAPIGMFLEIAPIVNIVPNTDLDIDGGIGARFYF